MLIGPVMYQIVAVQLVTISSRVNVLYVGIAKSKLPLAASLESECCGLDVAASELP